MAGFWENISPYHGLINWNGYKPDVLKLAARQGILVPQINRVLSLAAAGRTGLAKKQADVLQRDVENNLKGAITCGPNPPRDFRKVVIADFHNLPATNVAAGADLILAIQAVANFLPTGVPAQQRFLQAANQPPAGNIMRASIYGRTLVGLSVKFQFMVQASPGAVRGLPDEFSCDQLTDLFYQYQIQTFPSASQEPLMDASIGECFRGGRMLMENLRSPVINDNFNVLMLEPGNLAAIGSQALPAWVNGFATTVSGYVSVAGYFVDGV